MQNAADFSDETIRSFLLGRLSSTEQSVFEEQFLVNEELEARVRLAEFDLTDDYAFGRLSATDQTQFEQTFPLTTERKQKLNVSTALRDRFAPASVSKLPMAERLRVLVDFRKPAWRYAFAVLVLTLLVTTVWLVTKEPQIVQQFLPKRVLPKPAATSSPEKANHPSLSASPTHAQQSAQMPAHEAPSASIVVLNAKSTIDKAPAVKLPYGDNEVVRLQLVIEKNQARRYRAEVLTIAGQSIYSSDSLTSYDDLMVNLDIPARLIKPGDYQVRLTRSTNGSPEKVTSYYFRVQ